jgi:hypothetical protein
MSESMNQKIKKLLTLAERAGTKEEGEAARAAAMRLMTKWGIEEAMLGDISDKREEIVVKFTAPYPKLFIKARQAVTGCIIRGMGSMRIWVSGNTVAVMGYESDVDRALMFIPSILVQADHELARWWKSYEFRQQLSGGEALRARRNFLFAFGREVETRLTAMRKEEIKESDKVQSKSTALVLRDRDAEVGDAFDERMGGKLRKSRGLKGSAHGTAAGQAAGRRARLGGDSIGGGPRGVIG